MLLSSCGKNESGTASNAETTTTTAQTTETVESTSGTTELTTEATSGTTSETSSEATTSEATPSEAATSSVTDAAPDPASTAADPAPSGETIDSVKKIAEAIGKTINISDVIPMAASMIGAEDGISFKVGGNKFEIYQFAAGHAKLKEAQSGSMVITLEGFGDMTTRCTANGNYVMIYITPDNAVIEAFQNLSL